MVPASSDAKGESGQKIVTLLATCEILEAGGCFRKHAFSSTYRLFAEKALRRRGPRSGESLAVYGAVRHVDRL
jgi:hypothetical protein